MRILYTRKKVRKKNTQLSISSEEMKPEREEEEEEVVIQQLWNIIYKEERGVV